MTRTTPQAARQWLVSVLTAMTPSKRSQDKFTFMARLDENRSLATHKIRTFALVETSVVRSAWCFGGSALMLRMYVTYPYGVSAGASVADITGLIGSDYDDIRQTLEHRASWGDGIAGCQVGDAQILGSEEGSSVVMAAVEITVDYKPLGV